MAEEPEEKKREQAGGLGLGRLAMRQVAPAEAEVPAQAVPTRAWGKGLVVLLVIVLAGVIAWWVRVGSGMFPGEEEAQQLRQALEERKGWQYGILREVRLRRADTAELEVASEQELGQIAQRPEVAAWAAKLPVQVPMEGVETTTQEELGRLVKLAALEALEAFSQVAPSRDLFLVLGRGGEEIGHGEYFRRDGPSVMQKGRIHLEAHGEAAPGGAGRGLGE